MKQTHLLILDRAHGVNVAGKRSPDGKHLEYVWSNTIINKLTERLAKHDITVATTVSDKNEPGLGVRIKRANALALQASKQGLIPLLISFHNNAAANTGWSNATGIEVFTTVGQTKSDKYAEICLDVLAKYFPTVRQRVDMSDGDKDKEANFTVLTGKYYSAILIEFLFQDSVKDINLLLDSEINNRFLDAMEEFCVYINTR